METETVEALPSAAPTTPQIIDNQPGVTINEIAVELPPPPEITTVAPGTTTVETPTTESVNPVGFLRRGGDRARLEQAGMDPGSSTPS